MNKTQNFACVLDPTAVTGNHRMKEKQNYCNQRLLTTLNW